jgi:two-component system, NarL family, response regulator LiaR
MNSKKIRVAILDSNPKSRKHLVKLLGKEDDLEVIAEAETNLAGIREVEEHNPNIILMDNINSFTDGLETTEIVVSKFQDARIIVLSTDSSGNPMEGSSCFVGACLHLCQDCNTKEILAAIREGYQPKNGSAPKRMGQPNSFNQKEKQSCSVSQNNPG